MRLYIRKSIVLQYCRHGNYMYVILYRNLGVASMRQPRSQVPLCLVSLCNSCMGGMTDVYMLLTAGGMQLLLLSHVL